MHRIATIKQSMRSKNKTNFIDRSESIEIAEKSAINFCDYCRAHEFIQFYGYELVNFVNLISS